MSTPDQAAWGSRRAGTGRATAGAVAKGGGVKREAVLFLDVDGVLNCAGTRQQSPMGSTGIDPAKAAMVRRIAHESGCSIVVSSTWRRYRDLMFYLWRELGTDMKGRWAGNTPTLETRHESDIYSSPVRGEEIQAWLDANPGVQRFVIIDDDVDMAHLAPHLLRTHGCEGLTDQIADVAIARLTA